MAPGRSVKHFPFFIELQMIEREKSVTHMNTYQGLLSKYLKRKPIKFNEFKKSNLLHVQILLENKLLAEITQKQTRKGRNQYLRLNNSMSRSSALSVGPTITAVQIKVNCFWVYNLGDKNITK